MEQENDYMPDPKYFLMVWLMICCAVLMMFSSCRTKTVVVEKVHNDTTYIAKLQRDSVYMHDSIYVHEWRQGDTVWMARDRWHTAYRDRLLHDTIFKFVTDSVPVPYVVAELDFWQKVRLWLFYPLAALSLVLCIRLIIRNK